MAATSKLRLNIAYNVAFQILNIIVPIFTAPYVFRVLGKEGIGLYSYSFSIAHYFSLLCMLGIMNYGVREISMVSGDRRRLTEKFWQIYIVQVLAGLISLSAYVLLVLCCFRSDMEVFLMQGVFVLGAMLDVSWFLFGVENFRVTTIISVFNKVLTTTCIFLLVRGSGDVFIYVAILSLGGMLNNLFYWLIIRKYIDFSFCGVKHFFCHIKPILILFIPVIAINIYKYIDKIMLGAMLDISEVGIFEAAEKLQNLPMCLIAAFGTVMLPRISNMVANEQSSSVSHYNQMSFLLVMFLTFGMAFGLAGISTPFIPLFYGGGYEDSIVVLLWLLPSMVFVGWANIIRTQYLLPRRMDKVFCASVIAGAFVNVISNFILIPLMGAIGAGISTTLAEFTVCVYQSVIAFSQMNLRSCLNKVLPFMIIGGVMYLIISLINADVLWVTVMIRLIVGAIIYLALSAIYSRRIGISLKLLINK